MLELTTGPVLVLILQLAHTQAMHNIEKPHSSAMLGGIGGNAVRPAEFVPDIFRETFTVMRQEAGEGSEGKHASDRGFYPGCFAATLFCQNGTTMNMYQLMCREINDRRGHQSDVKWRRTLVPGLCMKFAWSCTVLLGDDPQAEKVLNVCRFDSGLGSYNSNYLPRCVATTWDEGTLIQSH